MIWTKRLRTCRSAALGEAFETAPIAAWVFLGGTYSLCCTPCRGLRFIGGVVQTPTLRGVTLGGGGASFVIGKVCSQGYAALCGEASVRAGCFLL